MNRRQLDKMCASYSLQELRDWLLHRQTEMFANHPGHPDIKYMIACVLLTNRLMALYRDESWLRGVWRKVFRR